MKIEAGKYYLTRDGQKVGPMEFRDWNNTHPWASDSDDNAIWEADGTRYRGAKKPETDLVAEWSEGPVRTRTVTTHEFVPGIYGVFKITKGADCPFLIWNGDAFINLGDDQRSRDKLTDAIATLTAIRDALVQP